MRRRSKLILAALAYGLLTVGALVALVPFAWVLFGAFKSQAEIMSNAGAWLPRSFLHFENFVELFRERMFGRYLANSLIVSLATVITNVIFGSMAGYALAKLEFPGQKLVFGCVLSAMMVPYIALFVPQFFVVVQLGLLNTLTAVVLPISVMPIGVFIMTQFARSVPNDLIDAARLDGANELTIFFRIFAPLARPAVAAIAIITFLNSWNYFLWPLIVAQNQQTYTLPVGLAVASQGAKSTEFGLLLAGAIVLLVPALSLFLLLQKHVVHGFFGNKNK